jgi:hypothetical protein
LKVGATFFGRLEEGVIATIAVAVLLAITNFEHLAEPWFSSLSSHITTVGT